MTCKKIAILISAMILLMLIGSISIWYYNDSMMFKSESIHAEFNSLCDMQTYADDFFNRKIGTMKYRLYEIKCEMDANGNGEMCFAYTKRTGYFRDVYFVVINTINNSIALEYQSEANRLYGGDYTVNVSQWKFGEDDFFGYVKGISYDRVNWQTIYGDVVVIEYYYDNVLQKKISINPYTNEII